jgi:hypothetical protein
MFWLPQFLSTLILFNVTPLLRAQGISLGVSRKKRRSDPSDPAQQDTILEQV